MWNGTVTFAAAAVRCAWPKLFGSMLALLLASTLTFSWASGLGSIGPMQAGPASVTVYSYQKSASPMHSHTWVVFRSGTESVTISWMPGGNTGLLTAPQPGRNWTHAKTLSYAATVKAAVRQWGPYPCTYSRFLKARAAVLDLESGRYLYSCFDAARPRGINCVTASLLPVGPYHGPFLYGFAAGEAVARRYAR